MSISRMLKSAGLLLAGTVLAAGAQAALITVNTGVDAGGNTMAEGQTDADWRISVDGGTTFNSSQVNYAAQICCGMESVANTAAWVTDSGTAGSAATGWGVGNVVYLRTTFDLSAFDLSSTQLQATWRLADDLVGIYLNGVEVQSAINSTWFTDRNLSVNSGFNQGLNTLEFRGSSINSNWDGLWVDGAVRGRDIGTSVPEPGTALLAALALVVAGAARRQAR